MSLISNVYGFKFFIESLGCLCSLEEVGRMPRRCAATLPPFWEKDIPTLSLLFLRGGGGGVDGGLGLGYTPRGSPDSKVSLREVSQYIRLGSLSDE